MVSEQLFSLVKDCNTLSETEFRKTLLAELGKLNISQLPKCSSNIFLSTSPQVDEVGKELQLGIPTKFTPIENSGGGDYLFKAVSQCLITH